MTAVWSQMTAVWMTSVFSRPPMNLHRVVHVLGVHTSAHARSTPEVTNPIKLGSSSVITNRNNLLVY